MFFTGFSCLPRYGQRHHLLREKPEDSMRDAPSGYKYRVTATIPNLSYEYDQLSCVKISVVDLRSRIPSLGRWKDNQWRARQV